MTQSSGKFGLEKHSETLTGMLSQMIGKACRETMGKNK